MTGDSLYIIPLITRITKTKECPHAVPPPRGAPPHTVPPPRGAPPTRCPPPRGAPPTRCPPHAVRPPTAPLSPAAVVFISTETVRQGRGRRLATEYAGGDEVPDFLRSDMRDVEKNPRFLDSGRYTLSNGR